MSALTRICAGGLCLMLLLVFAGAAQAHRVNIWKGRPCGWNALSAGIRRYGRGRSSSLTRRPARNCYRAGRTGKGRSPSRSPRSFARGTDCVSASWPGKGIRTSGRWMLLNFPVCCLLPGRGRRCRTGRGWRERSGCSGRRDGDPEPQGCGSDRRCGAGPASGPCAACPCRRQRSGARPAGHRGRSGLDHGPGGHRTVLFPAPALA